MLDTLNGKNFDYIIDFFQESAVAAMGNLYPYSNYLLAVISILVLCFTWNLYSGELKIQFIFQKVFQFGFIFLLIKNWNVIVRWTYDMLARIGTIAATGSDNYQVIKASSILNKGFEISKNIVGNSSIFSTTGWFLWLASFLTIVAFWFIAFQLTMTLIIYYIISVAAIFLIPLGMINFLKSYFQKAIGGIINLSIRIMIMFFMVGLIDKYISSLKDGFINKAAANADFQYIHNALIIFTLGYLTYKIPEMAADILSGNPSFGNSATAAVGGAIGGYAGAKAAQVGGYLGGKAKQIGGYVGGAAASGIKNVADKVDPFLVERTLGGSQTLAAQAAARELGGMFDKDMENSNKKTELDPFERNREANLKAFNDGLKGKIS